MLRLLKYPGGGDRDRGRLRGPGDRDRDLEEYLRYPGDRGRGGNGNSAPPRPPNPGGGRLGSKCTGTGMKGAASGLRLDGGGTTVSCSSLCVTMLRRLLLMECFLIWNSGLSPSASVCFAVSFRGEGLVFWSLMLSRAAILRARSSSSSSSERVVSVGWLAVFVS